MRFKNGQLAPLRAVTSAENKESSTGQRYSSSLINSARVAAGTKARSQGDLLHLAQIPGAAAAPSIKHSPLWSESPLVLFATLNTTSGSFVFLTRDKILCRASLV